MFDRNHPKHVILGAGISGLTLAWFLKKKNPNTSITLLEKENQIGGWMQTEHTDGFLFERGPHSLRLSPPYDEACYELFNDLDLTSKMIEPERAAKKRFLSYNNKLHPLSLHPLKLLAPQNFFKLTYPILKGLRQKNNAEIADEDIASFFKRYFGDYITQQFIDPFVMGIKGGDIEKLSLKSCFPLLEKLSKKEKPLLSELIKNLKKSPAKLISFERGFSDLIEAFEEKLDAEIILNSPVLKIKWHPNPTVITDKGEIECDHIFSTLPTSPLVTILKEHSLSSLNFLTEQKKISYKIIHLGFNQTLDLPDAFGFIAPSWSYQKISGTIFDSKIYPSQNSSLSQTRLTVMIHENSSLFNENDSVIKKEVLKELEALLKIRTLPDYFKCTYLNGAIPQYHVGHHEKLEAFKSELKEKYPRFTFLGNSFYGLSVPMCIDKAYQIANSARLITHNA